MATTLTEAFRVIFSFFVGFYQFLTMNVVEASKLALGFIDGLIGGIIPDFAIDVLGRLLTYVLTWGGLAGDNPTIMTFLFGAGVAGVAIYFVITVCIWILDLVDKLPLI